MKKGERYIEYLYNVPTFLEYGEQNIRGIC